VLFETVDDVIESGENDVLSVSVCVMTLTRFGEISSISWLMAMRC